MNILVCIKQVPGTMQVEVDERTGVLKRDGIPSKMNPYDLYAIETALQIKAIHGATVSVVSMGPPQAETIIREAFMMGADRGMLLSDQKFAGADTLATAFTLAQGIEKGCNPDIIICGKMTTDGDTAQVGPEIAEFMDIPHVANVTKIISISKELITVEMDMPHATEVVEVRCPCLITVGKGIYQPRLPSYKLKLKTENFPVSFFSLSDFDDQDEMKYGLNGSPTQVKHIFPPESNTVQETWTGPSEVLVEQLFDKLKELKFV